MANVVIDTAGTVTRPMRRESPGQDVGLDDPRPSLRATTGVEDPRWLWARVGDGGVNGQEVWVRYLAEDAPHGVPVVAAHGPSSGEPGARLVTSAPVVGYPASGRANAERNGAVRAAPVLVPVPAVVVPSANADLNAGFQLLEVLGRAVRGLHAAPETPKPIVSASAKYMRIMEFGDHRRVKRATVRTWLRLGLPHVGGGRSTRILVQAADAWLDAGGPEVGIEQAARVRARTGRP